MAEAVIDDVAGSARRREQRSWYWYDWANSGYVTTVQTVLFAPYLISVAERAAVDDRVSVLGVGIAPGSLPAFLVTFSTVLSALLLPPLGALADRTVNKKGLLAGFAWAGSAFAALLFWTRGDQWWIGAVSLIGANLCLAASLVVNDAILPLISTEDERDRVSSRGWAFGYLGGAVLLTANLALVLGHDAVGLGEGTAVRISLASAAVWWAAFTVVPYRGLRNRPLPPSDAVVTASGRGVVAESFGQLARTLREMRHYPVALTFLASYLFFNDGIQTVIASSSTYGSEELGFGDGVLIGTVLLVQFVAFAGAILFGRAAARFGAKPVILAGIVGWIVVVSAALVVPAGALVAFLALGVAIGIVLGGTQALARSYFSLLVPRGKEAEFFSFYHAMDRGTSWFGTLTFGVVYQLTGSYRPAIFALVVFFLLGGALLLRVDTARGIAQAGNHAPGAPSPNPPT